MVSSNRIYTWLGITSSATQSNSLVTSPVFSSLKLACIRLTFALYTLGTVVAALVHDSVYSSKHDAGGFFSYFTHLSYIGVTTYFWASGVQTLAYAVRGQKTYPLQRWPRFLQFLHRLLYSSITTFPIVVTVVYWAILSSAETFITRYSAWSNISQHALNTIFILFEILLTRCGPSPWCHLPFLIFFLAGYLGIAYITHATEGFYTYSFLDPKKQHGVLAAYIIGIGVGECVVFSVVWGMCYFRERFLKRSAACDDVEEGHDGHEKIEEWEEIERPKTPSMNEI